MTPEGKIKKAVRTLLHKLNHEIGTYHFMPVQMGYGSSTLDFLCCVQGRFVAIECKRPGVDTMTPRQLVASHDIEKAGGIALLVNDDDAASMKVLEDILRGLAPK